MVLEYILPISQYQKILLKIHKEIILIKVNCAYLMQNGIFNQHLSIWNNISKSRIGRYYILIHKWITLCKCTFFLSYFPHYLGIHHTRFQGHGYFFSWANPKTKNLTVNWLTARNICRRHCMDLISLGKDEYHSNLWFKN